ncbi:helix-turn-helix domain-containing protein [Geminisphaera colitermitum]|uniref:helix-turn-helix domain-containing protein n=1 Tax=Geminisphaera colitermitum TaxID=1148786 RepID=UPI0012FF04B8|nr:helix-turn-helix transcriptional regulator [Geminisphaera colitermitum]
MNYSEKISHLLKTRGVSIRAFATGVGMEYAGIHKIVTGRIKNPHPNTKHRIAEFFGISVEQLFDDTVSLNATNAKKMSYDNLEKANIRILELEKENAVLNALLQAKEKEIARLHETFRADASISMPAASSPARSRGHTKTKKTPTRLTKEQISSLEESGINLDEILKQWAGKSGRIAQ